MTQATPQHTSSRPDANFSEIKKGPVAVAHARTQAGEWAAARRAERAWTRSRPQPSPERPCLSVETRR
jgi:hypothetical protein